MTSSIKPPALHPGDTIGIAAPASTFHRETLLHGIEHIREAGYKILFRPDIFSQNGYLAGTDRRRTNELEIMFMDRRVKAIFCARGGYGSQRLLPLLDENALRNNPKIFMGYSDITALHSFLQKVCGMVTFHGPLVTEMADRKPKDLRSIFDALANREPWGTLSTGLLDVLRPGRTEGLVTGGSLTVFTQMLGTRYEPDTEGMILFFEDRGEKPYAIDRLFSHVKLAGKFDRAAGLILGQFTPPVDWSKGEQAYSDEIKRIVLDLLEDFRFPIVRNFPAGHFDGSICFPFGVRATLDGEHGAVSVNEPCLS